MACECFIDDGLREFPSLLLTIYNEAYASSIKNKRKCLGGRSNFAEFTDVNMKVVFESKKDIEIFTEWFCKEIDYGTKSFLISLDVFGVTKTYTAYIKNGIKANTTQFNTTEMSLVVTIMDDIADAITQNECFVCT